MRTPDHFFAKAPEGTYLRTSTDHNARLGIVDDINLKATIVGLGTAGSAAVYFFAQEATEHNPQQYMDDFLRTAVSLGAVGTIGLLNVAIDVISKHLRMEPRNLEEMQRLDAEITAYMNPAPAEETIFEIESPAR